jgi:hypothetical protein
VRKKQFRVPKCHVHHNGNSDSATWALALGIRANYLPDHEVDIGTRYRDALPTTWNTADDGIQLRQFH